MASNQDGERAGPDASHAPAIRRSKLLHRPAHQYTPRGASHSSPESPTLLAPRPVTDNVASALVYPTASTAPSNPGRRVPLPLKLAQSSRSGGAAESSMKPPPRSQNVRHGRRSQSIESTVTPARLNAKASADFAADTNGLYGSPIAEEAEDEEEDFYDEEFDAQQIYSTSPSPPTSPPRSADLPSDSNVTQHPHDPLHMLQQMRSTAGSMRGNVMLRSSEDSDWHRCYAYIQSDTGDFRKRAPRECQYEMIISDLRRCQVQVQNDSRDGERTILVTPRDQSRPILFRPDDKRLVDNWFAACLSWSCVAPKQGLQGGAGEYQFSTTADPAAGTEKASKLRSTASVATSTIKSGDAILAEHLLHPDGSHTLSTTRVLCVVRSEGRLSIRNFETREMITSIDVGNLPRSAIQRLHRSAFGTDFAVAIYAHYAQCRVSYRIRPVELTFECRETFESWYIMLRAIARPEFFGMLRPKIPSSVRLDHTNIDSRLQNPSIFRIEHSIDLRLIRMKLTHSSSASNPTVEKRPSLVAGSDSANIAIEICLDEHIKARTAARASRSEIFWDTNFCFEDMSSRVSSMTLRVIEYFETCGEKSTFIGDVTVDLNDTLLSENFEGNLPVLDIHGTPIGEVSLELKHAPETILLEHEYDGLAKLLNDHRHGLTLLVTQRLPPSMLSAVARYFLNVYQASSSSTEWLKALIEQELGGPQGATKPRPYSTDGGALESSQARGSTTISSISMQATSSTADAVLLFRGNSLLTKALELYMKRIGNSYLELTLGDKLRELAQTTEHFEVDPNRIPHDQDTQASWERLIRLTNEFWRLISDSANQCPAELSMLFRHVRTCARRRFGTSVPSVDYTSVSGFLFLRYFCAAILGPQLFGLVDERTPITPQAQRAFMLVAKSLQGLANLSTFGHKEPWMAPMNTFCSSNRQSFKSFIDHVCAGPLHDDYGPTQSARHLSSNMTTTLEKFSQLPALSKEGFPSFPDLIDGPRNLARLVSVWCANSDKASSLTSGVDPTGKSSMNGVSAGASIGDFCADFDRICRTLRQKSLKLVDQADRNRERVNPVISLKWIALAEAMEACPSRYWLVTEQSTDTREPEMQRQQRFDSVISSTASDLSHVTSLEKPSETPKSSKLLAFAWDASREKRDKKVRQSVDVVSNQASQRKASATSQGELQSPRGGRPPSMRSNESATSMATTTKSGRRKKSPPRTADQNAMRKLGLI